MDELLKPCPHCGRKPQACYGATNGVYGESIECDCDESPSVCWKYTDWEKAVKRWNKHATRKNHD